MPLLDTDERLSLDVCARALVWTIVQTSIGISCACLPTFTSLFDSSVKGSFAKYVPMSFSFSSRSRNSTGKSSHGSEGQRHDAAAQIAMNAWDNVSLVGSTVWQTEELSLEARRSARDDGIMVQQDVHADNAGKREISLTS